MIRPLFLSTFLATTLAASLASAARSAELYTAESYGYGRIAARIRFAPGDGVISSFFMWKDGSEVSGTFWNELDFEKVGGDCHVESNALYGSPVAGHVQKHTLESDPCGGYHVYSYEWTPESIAWFVDDVEIRRDMGPTATAFADNAPEGMQIRFNVWPGNASFGGNFNPAIMPVHQFVDWVEFSSYADGEFTFEWREEFDGETLPAGWLTGSWASPKNLSTHDRGNVNLLDGYAVLSLTADDAVGPKGASPEGPSGAGGTGTSAPPSGGDDGGCSVAGPSTRGPGAWLAALGLAILGLLGRSRRGRSVTSSR